VHTDFFVLIDKNRNVRGYYHSLKDDMTADTASLSKLARDVIYLSLEKDPNKKSVFAGKLELILIVLVAVLLGLVVLSGYSL
jgi:protein SCO1